MADVPGTKVLAVTAMNDPKAVQKAVSLGFHGYLTKDTSMPRFVDSVKAAAAGQVVVPHRLVAGPGAEASEEERQAAMLADQLTPREVRVLALLVEGAGSPTISDRLSISPNTVRTHIQNILTKLQVHSRLQAAALATRHGIVGGSAGPFAEPRVSPRPGRWLSSEDGALQEKPDRRVDREMRSDDGRVRVERREPGGSHDDSQEIR